MQQFLLQLGFISPPVTETDAHGRWRRSYTMATLHEMKREADEQGKYPVDPGDLSLQLEPRTQGAT